jgi:hypothetical protein
VSAVRAIPAGRIFLHCPIKTPGITFTENISHIDSELKKKEEGRNKLTGLFLPSNRQCGDHRL